MSIYDAMDATGLESLVDKHLRQIQDSSSQLKDAQQKEKAFEQSNAPPEIKASQMGEISHLRTTMSRLEQEIAEAQKNLAQIVSVCSNRCQNAVSDAYNYQNTRLDGIEAMRYMQSASYQEQLVADNYRKIIAKAKSGLSIITSGQSSSNYFAPIQNIDDACDFYQGRQVSYGFSPSYFLSNSYQTPPYQVTSSYKWGSYSVSPTYKFSNGIHDTTF